jgi:hypothetical protein
VVLSGLECPLDACRNGTLMARSRESWFALALIAWSWLVIGWVGVKAQIRADDEGVENLASA